MKPSSTYIQRVYLILLLLNTLAASMIWGINTLFLIDAGLSNFQAFLANAFFTIGQVIFEVPTGIVADVKGRRTSYVLGTVTLAVSTVLYYSAWQMQAGMWLWAVSSILLGLGFTFFSGATEAWLVDALKYSNYEGKLDDVFAKGQIVSGAAMLIGSVSGGVIAQATNLGVPYLIRATLLLVTTGIAVFFMKDWGFEPEKRGNVLSDVQKLFVTSLELGMKNPAIRWVMLAAPFSAGVGFFAFYAMQPLLLELYQDEKAYTVAGMAAAIVAAAQILGGFLVPHLHKLFRSRTAVLVFGCCINVLLFTALALTQSFVIAVVLLCVWGLLGSVILPVRQAYINGLIPSKQRATVLSFDSLMGSSGGVVIQPVLGKVADAWSYSASFFVSACIQLLALPFYVLLRKENATSDRLE